MTYFIHCCQINMLLSLFYRLITMVYLVFSSVNNITGLNESHTLFDKHMSFPQFKEKCHLKEENENTQIYNSNVKKNTALFQSILFDNEFKSRRQMRISYRRRKRSSCIRQKRSSNRRQKRSSNSDIYRRSICPWINVWDMDTERSPLFIPKAKCSSRKCHFNFTELVIPEIIEVLTTCEPLTTDIRIYKNNEERYLKDWPIACTCSRKVVSKDSAIRKKGNSGQDQNARVRNIPCTEGKLTRLKKFKGVTKIKKSRKGKKLHKTRRHKMRRQWKKVKKRRCWRFNKEKRRFLRIFPCSFRGK